MLAPSRPSGADNDSPGSQNVVAVLLTGSEANCFLHPAPQGHGLTFQTNWMRCLNVPFDLLLLPAIAPAHPAEHVEICIGRRGIESAVRPPW